MTGPSYPPVEPIAPPSNSQLFSPVNGAHSTLHANVDAELLQEILHVYDARKERVKGFDTLYDLLVLFPNPIAITGEEIETARDLMRAHSFLGARDAIHAAVVQTHDLEGIISADKVFDRIKGVKRFGLK